LCQIRNPLVGELTPRFVVVKEHRSSLLSRLLKTCFLQLRLLVGLDDRNHL
jgi:hypothetical protein